MSTIPLFPLYFSFILITLLSSKTTAAFNITKILSQSSDFSSLNDVLSKTQLAEAINGRKTLTILAVDNGKVSSLSGKSSDELKMIVSLHVILDYYDVPKLQNLPNKSTIVTTLFQSSGQARGQQGFLNITSSGNGVTFGSAVPGSTQNVNLVKSIASEPYNITVLQVSDVIVPPGLGSGGGGGGGGGGNGSVGGGEAAPPAGGSGEGAAPPAGGGSGGGGAAPPANNNSNNTSPSPTSSPKGSTTPPAVSPSAFGGGGKQAPAPSNGKPPGNAAAPPKSSSGGKAPAPSAGVGGGGGGAGSNATAPSAGGGSDASAPSGDAANSPATAPITGDTPATSPPAMAAGPNAAETPDAADGPVAETPAEGSSAYSPLGISFASVFLMILPSAAWALA